LVSDLSQAWAYIEAGQSTFCYQLLSAHALCICRWPRAIRTSPNHHPIPPQPRTRIQIRTQTQCQTQSQSQSKTHEESATRAAATQQNTANPDTGGQPFCRHLHISLISSVAALPLVGASARRTLGGLEHARYLIRTSKRSKGLPTYELPLPASCFDISRPALLGSIQGGTKPPSTRKSLKPKAKGPTHKS
jgi:hypothetical protein